MNDEKYVYIQDVKDKKCTARSARNMRTHSGKGGSVKFPSDYMTQKEIKAMSGEVKSYRLNEPMNWKEFKAMPDDIKVSYINLIRQKYNAPDSHICKMMGTNVCSFSQEMHRLEIPSTRKPSEKWDKECFYAWANGVPVHKEEPVEETLPAEYYGDINQTFAERLKGLRKAAGLSQAELGERLGTSVGSIFNYETCRRTPDIEFLSAVCQYFDVSANFLLSHEAKPLADIPIHQKEPVEEAVEEVKFPIPECFLRVPAAPLRGTLDYEGTAEDIFSTLNKIVGTGNVRMTISWEAV